MFSNIEFKRECVIALHLEGKSQSTIMKELKYLKLNKMFVSRTINRYKETGSIAKRYGGGPKRRATGPDMVAKVKEQIQWNSMQSARKIASQLHVSEWSVRQILKSVLKNDDADDAKSNDHEDAPATAAAAATVRATATVTATAAKQKAVATATDSAAPTPAATAATAFVKFALKTPAARKEISSFEQPAAVATSETKTKAKKEKSKAKSRAKAAKERPARRGRSKSNKSQERTSQESPPPAASGHAEKRAATSESDNESLLERNRHTLEAAALRRTTAISSIQFGSFEHFPMPRKRSSTTDTANDADDESDCST